MFDPANPYQTPPSDQAADQGNDPAQPMTPPQNTDFAQSAPPPQDDPYSQPMMPPQNDTPPSGMTRMPLPDWSVDGSSDSSASMSTDSPSTMSPDLSMDSVPQPPSPSLADDSGSLADAGSNPAPALAPQTPSEKLEDQNIFYLLGVTDGTEEQKNQFLDELQQVIWEDFLEEDVKLLLTQEEQAELDKLKAAKPDAKLEEQEEVIVYLEKLIPDLEDILLEKALELKADLMKERMAGMREFHKDKPDALAAIDQADQLLQSEQWLSAATALNAIPQS